MKQIARTKGTLLRVFACVWAVVALALTCAAPAFAADVPTGSITVNNVDGASSGSVYKVIDVNWKGSEPVDPMYKWNDSVAQWVRDKYPTYIGDGNQVTEAYSKAEEKAMKAFAEALQLAIINGNPAVTAAQTQQITSTPVTFNGIEAGGYLVSIAGNKDVFTPVISNLVPTYASDAWSVQNVTVDAKKSKVTFEKKIARDNGLYDTATAGIGEDVTFNLIATAPIYSTNAQHKVFKISDTLSKGLTFKDGLLKVVAGEGDGAKTLVEGDDYEVSAIDSTNSFTVTFKNFDAIAGSKVVVEYKATLNGEAVVGEAGNPNNATLTYSHNPYVEHEETEIPDEVKVYTFGIEVFKRDKADQTVYLKGAAFKVKDANGTEIKFVRLSDGVYRVATAADAENTKVTELNVGEDGNMLGKLDIKGFDAGNYKLEETKAPSGYTRLGSAVDVTLEAVKDGDEFTGHLTNESTTKVGYVHEDVLNSHGWSLPKTGDAGLFALVAAGIVLVGGGIMVVRSRRAE